MFPAQKKGEWEPLKVREKKVPKTSSVETVPAEKDDGEDTAMGGVNGNGRESEVKSNGMEEEILYEEDPTTEEGAVFPLKNGRVTNWSCFYALLSHVYNTLSPPFHTPIIVIAQAAWTEQDHETLTQFFFEKFKTPAFCLMDSALAVCYAYGIATATVVDVGYGKCDVSAVNDFLVNDVGRGIALEGCGGEGMTERLFDLLSSKGFTMDMCEQLKKSSICEILPPGSEFPHGADGSAEVTNPAAAASTGATGSGPSQRGSISAQGELPRGPVPDTDVGDEDQDREAQDGDDDGVVDVASIVASGKTSEFLARKEKEKQEKAAKKAAQDLANLPKARLPNSKREKATLHYDAHRDAAAATEEHEEVDGVIRKGKEVGTERFRAADGGILDQIADSVHRAVLAVPELSRRSELWDNLVVIGNGSKVRGMSPHAVTRTHPDVPLTIVLR